MTCTSCGAELSVANSRFCPACGSAVSSVGAETQGVSAAGRLEPAIAPSSARPRAVQLSAYLCIGQVVLLVVSICLASQLLGAVFEAMANRGTVPVRGFFALASLAALASAVVYCVVPFFALLYGLAGAGLLKRWSWARGLALGLSFVTAVISFPLGTLLAVPVIVLLFKPEAKAVFARSVPASPIPAIPGE